MKQPVEIEHDVQMVSANGLGRYPWEDMQVGDSIKFKTKTAANGAAERANQRFETLKFRAGFDKNGQARVWRVAE